MSGRYPRTQRAAEQPPDTSTQRLMPQADDGPGVSDEPALATGLDLLDDGHVRTILTATSVEPLSAKELSDRCDVSTATIYRRLDRLTDAGLVAERTRPRADGHHDTVYAATLEEFSVRLHDGKLTFDVDRRGDDVADRLTRLWEEF